jgi:hypothetical protein
VRSDIREALRSFTTEPGFSLVVVVTLALAIGINSAIFSVLNGVLLRPLDYADPGRLVVVWESNQAAGQPQSETSGATYLDWRARTRTFSGLGAFRYRGFTLRADRESEHIASVEASPALFRVLGVPPLAGRVFTDEEEEPGLRMALGAGAGDAFRLVVGGAARVVLAGVVLGFAGAAALGKAFDSLLFGVPAFDAMTFIASGLALMLVGVVAASLPAARAARIDPAGTLRS